MATAAHQPITAQTLDTAIWRDGFAYGGGELDFLRAIHRRHNVQQLARFLRQQHPGLPIRVTSIWLDKFPICEPTSAGATRTTRELGDLGIAVRRRSVGGTPASRFWILQGKVNGPSWQTQGESPKEIELYETCPAFDLYTSGHKKHKLGSFDLAGGGGGKGFGTPVKKTGFPFWNFLMFDPPVAQAGPLCMAHCWDSGGAHQASFAAGISAMVQRLGVDDDDHGARVDAGTRYPEWKRLYEVLFRHSSRASTGRLSGGKWRHAALAFQLMADVLRPPEFESLGFAFGSPDESVSFVTTGYGEQGGLPPLALFEGDEWERAQERDAMRDARPPRRDAPLPGNGEDDGEGGLPLLIIDLLGQGPLPS